MALNEFGRYVNDNVDEFGRFVLLSVSESARHIFITTYDYLHTFVLNSTTYAGVMMKKAKARRKGFKM